VFLHSSAKIAILKNIDRLAGALLARVISPPSAGQVPSAPGRILIIRPGGIGDAVLLVPAIRSLAHAFPGTSIDILSEKRNCGVFALCPEVHRVYHYERWAELRAVLRNRYCAVIDTEQWHRLSAVVARLTNAPASIGFASNERRRLFTHPVDYRQHEYEMDCFFRLLTPLAATVSPELSRRFLKIPVSSAKRAGELLRDCREKPFIVIFPGASIPERRWGEERFRDLVHRFVEKGIRSVIIGGREDAEIGNRIINGTQALNLAGKTTLAETAAIIDRSSLLLSGDSGILHIAVGLDVPTVSLFGPGIEAKWAPKGKKHVIINKKLACSPCTKFGYTPKCPIDARCMSEISVEEVVAAVIELFEKYAKV